MAADLSVVSATHEGMVSGRGSPNWQAALWWLTTAQGRSLAAAAVISRSRSRGAGLAPYGDGHEHTSPESPHELTSQSALDDP